MLYPKTLPFFYDQKIKLRAKNSDLKDTMLNLPGLVLDISGHFSRICRFIHLEGEE